MTGFELTSAALDAPGLSSSERLVFALVCKSCDGSGVAYLCKQEEIALKADLGIRTVRNALAELEERGWIRRTRRHRQSGERGVDVITVTPNAKAGKLPAFKIDLGLALERAKAADPVVEPSQRMMPLPAVVAGQDRDAYRQPLPVGQPATIAASEADDRQPLPVGQPATIAAQYQTSFSDDSYKPGASGRPPLESGGPPPPLSAKEQAAELMALADQLRAGPIPDRLKRTG